MPAPRKYPDELCERAVREVRSTGRPVAHVARDLGIHKEALRSWVRQAEVDAGERDDRLTTVERDELKELRKEVAELRRANEILKAASVFLPRRSTVPGRGRAGDRPPARRLRGRSRLPGAGAVAVDGLRDEELIPLVTAVWEESGRTYGARRITRALVRAGHQVARCTVERLMRELGIEGVIRGQRRRTTVPEPMAPRPSDLVNRRFTAQRPNQLWLADLTYVRTWSGWVYVAFVLDAYSRRIVGWQAATHMRTDLPLDALEMALWRQKIKKDADLIHHSDRGSQYVSIRYTERLVEVGASASVGSVADSYDNAMAEALNGTFKAELIEHQGPWRDFDEVERAVFQWVAWYNNERLHSALGYVPPDEYEQAYWTGLEQHPQVA